VIGFGGDAVTCWFDPGLATGEEDDAERAPSRAVSCAPRMRTGLTALGDRPAMA
jgi:hypothetical protein